MPHPSDITKQVLDRLRNLKEFTVRVPVRENWLPNGVVPFDIKIKDGIATVTLPALDADEAKQRAVDYFNKDSTED